LAERLALEDEDDVVDVLDESVDVTESTMAAHSAEAVGLHRPFCWLLRMTRMIRSENFTGGIYTSDAPMPMGA
jgi:hypothetical protein